MALKLLGIGLEGVATLSEGETNTIWGAGDQGYFYINKEDSKNLPSFCNGVKICEVKTKELNEYFFQGLQIVNKYKSMFDKDDYERFVANKTYFENEKSIQFYMLTKKGQGNGQSHIKIINNNDTRRIEELRGIALDEKIVMMGEKLRHSILAGITKVRFEEKDGKILVTLEIIEKWGDILMGKSDFVELQKLITVFEQEVDSQCHSGKDLKEAAQIFGIRYQPVICNNNIVVSEIVDGSKYANNTDELVEAIKNGMNISSEIIWETKFVEEKPDSKEEEYEKFKKLLGWFVRQLDINNDLEEGEHTSGQGYKENSSLREKYSMWREYEGFTLDCNIVSGYSKTSEKLNYINKTTTGINVRPHFDPITKRVIAVYLDVYDEDNDISSQDSELTKQMYRVEQLELFDESAPNDLLRKLFNQYKELMENDVQKPVSIDCITYETSCNDEITLDGKTIKLERNRIFFGAPGTGKSHELDKQTKAFVGDSYERVTFHPEYTHSGFFGTYKPIPCENNKDKITYKFIPGPFLRVLSKALINANVELNPHPFVLLIEEINRANMAAVFGEVFQLLDRDESNASKYSISPSEDVKNYLVKEFGKAGVNITKEAFNELRIPNNMFIWASMNSADQGVFPMDTAFKRRWDFEYFNIDDNEEVISSYTFNICGKNVNWNSLRKAINQRLISLRINEDKLLGPFFIGVSVLKEGNNEKIIKAIKNKVIMYLFEDAARQKRKDVFVNGYEKTYSQICEDFDTKGLGIFTAENP